MNGYKEKLINSGLNLSDEQVDKCIEIAIDVSNRSDMTVETALDTLIAVLMYETIVRNKNMSF